MAYDIKAALDFMYGLQAKGTRYSMEGARDGSDGTADCSGSVYAALLAAGVPSADEVLDTETMHDWLMANGFVLIAEGENDDTEKQIGDIVVWGKRGRSEGEYGHTGIMIDSVHLLNCNGSDAMTLDNHATNSEHEYWEWHGRPYCHLYRYAG